MKKFCKDALSTGKQCYGFVFVIVYAIFIAVAIHLGF